MKECDILGVKTYSEPTYIFRETRPPNLRLYVADVDSTAYIQTEFVFPRSPGE